MTGPRGVKKAPKTLGVWRHRAGVSAGLAKALGRLQVNYLSGAMRNPSAAPAQFTNLLIGFALAEATGLFGLLIALIILFG